jgi:two-component system sensor kinase FixL
MYGDSLPPENNGAPADAAQGSATQSFGRQHLEPEQVRQLNKGFPLSLVASVVIASMLSASHWEVIAHADIILWNLILGSVLLVRLILWLSWHNLHQLYSARFWLNSYRLSAWLTGTAWGSAALFLFATEDATYQALLAFALAGVATSSITSLTVDKYCAIGFVVLAISPLSIVMLLHDGPTTIAMAGMSLIFIFFVIASATRTRRNMENQLNKQFELLHLSETLNKKQHQEHIINNAQSIYIRENNIQSALNQLLHDTLELSDSKLGFIGQVDKDPQNQPFMRALIFASSKPNDLQLTLFREKNLPSNGEFHNLSTIFGSILLSGKPLISSHLARDLRAATLPPGHPTVESFIGIPIFNGKEQIAILGLANSPAGYTNNTAMQLEPILKSIAQFVQTLNHEHQHEHDQAALEASNQQHQTILNDIADGIVIINKEGMIESFNHAAETIFGYRAPQIIGKNITELMPDPYKSMHDGYLKNHLRTGKKNIIGIGREVRGLRRNGDEFPMDLMVSRVYQQGEPVFIGIIRDITEKKRLDDLRTQFISAASREILGPLNLISEAITLLHKRAVKELPKHLANLTEIAQTNSHQLQKLMSDLIEMQTLSRGDMPFNLSHQAASALIREEVKRQQAFSEIYQSKVHITENTSNLMIHTDADRFEQAIGHVLQYLYKISGNHGVVHIILSEKYGKIKIGMHCNTHKLSDSARQNLRQQLGQTTNLIRSNYHDNNELGLVIAKEIIEKMHGKIELIDSNKTMEFALTFPQAPQQY